MIDRLSIITIGKRYKHPYSIDFIVINLTRVNLRVLVKTLRRHHAFHFIPDACHATLSLHELLALFMN
jgi:hypothetical protein